MKYLTECLILALLLATTGCNTTPEQWQQASRSWNAGMPQQGQQGTGQQCTMVDIGGGIYDQRCQ